MLFLQDNPIGDALNNTEWAFPAAECFHIVGFGIAIGAIAVVDLRLMGAVLTAKPASYVHKQTWLWTLFALMIVIFSGLALFLSDPTMYERNASFNLKMIMLGVAILYNYTIHLFVVKKEDPGGLGKLVGLVSILLWVSVVACGLFIAFV